MHCLPSNVGVLVVRMGSRGVRRACTPGNTGGVSGPCEGIVWSPAVMSSYRAGVSVNHSALKHRRGIKGMPFSSPLGLSHAAPGLFPPTAAKCDGHGVVKCENRPTEYRYTSLCSFQMDHPLCLYLLGGP